MLDKITYEKDKTYLTYEGSKHEIARMDSLQSGVWRKQKAKIFTNLRLIRLDKMR